ncbi:MAG: hypothetical protein ACJ76P_05950 [Actinomycetota bacterium]
MTLRRDQSAPIDLAGLLRKRSKAPGELPDIVTFAEHPSFVGDSGPGLLPRQRTALRLFYGERAEMSSYDEDVIEGWRNSFGDTRMRVGVPYDVWDRLAWLEEQGRRHFGTVLFIGGRRGGKGHLGAIMAAYEWAYLLSLGDPQAALGIARGHHLMTIVAATEFRQARDAQFADISRIVLNGGYFAGRVVSVSRSEVAVLTDADSTRCAELGIKDERQVALQATLRARAFGSNASAARGIAASALIFDEFAHHIATDEGSTAEDVYRALTPALAQMGPHGLVYVPTSPWSRQSYAYKLYTDALAVNEDGTPGNPDMILLQAPSYELYGDSDDPVATDGRTFTQVPFRYDEDQRRIEARDPRAFRTEIHAQWAEAEDTYLDPEQVDRMFAPVCDRHAAPTLEGGVCGVCGEQGRVLLSTATATRMVPYRGHADPGVTDSNFAVAVGHYELRDDEHGEPTVHVFIDFAKVWRGADYTDHQIPYPEVERELVELVVGYPTMERFTLDQLGAFATVPELNRKLRARRSAVRVLKRNHTASENLERWETAKAAIGEGVVHMFADDYGPNGTSLASAELKALRYRNGKVAKPTAGPVTTNDLATAVSVLVAELLKDAYERVPLRRSLTEARLQAGLPAHGPPDLGARAVLDRYPHRRVRNPYGHDVPPDRIERRWRRLP